MFDLTNVSVVGLHSCPPCAWPGPVPHGLEDLQGIFDRQNWSVVVAYVPGSVRL